MNHDTDRMTGLRHFILASHRFSLAKRWSTDRPTSRLRRLGQAVAALAILSPLFSLISVTPVAQAAATGTWRDLTYNQIFSSPFALTIDSAGNLYVANPNGAINGLSVLKLAPGTTTWQPISNQGIPIAPVGIAVNSAGSLYVTDVISSALAQYSAAGGGTWNPIPSTVTPDYTPGGIAVNSAGDVFVTNSAGTVAEYIPGTQSWKNLTYTGVSFNQPGGIAVDSSGDLFVTNYGSNTIAELPAGTKTWHYINETGVTFSGPMGIAVDSAGNLFVASRNNNMVAELPAGSQTWQALSGPFNGPNGVAVNSAGNLFVTNVNNTNVDAIIEYTPPAPPVLVPETVTVNGITAAVVGDLGANSAGAIQQGTTTGYVEERAAIEAGATFSGEGIDSHVTPEQQGQFAALYQRLKIIPTWTDNSVSIFQGVSTLLKAGASDLAIENYLVQIDGFSWAAAQSQAAADYPILSGT
jgi:streptogramin lyase